jgi:hypothetical protein
MASCPLSQSGHPSALISKTHIDGIHTPKLDLSLPLIERQVLPFTRDRMADGALYAALRTEAVIPVLSLYYRQYAVIVV